MIWTPERRVRQAELIRLWKPWEKSTGPRTPDGKAKAARNAWKGGHWRELRELRRVLVLALRNVPTHGNGK